MTPNLIKHPARDFISRHGQTPKMIVIHATAGTTSLGWLSGNQNGTSIHVLIEKDGTAYRMVDDEHGANHVGFSRIVLGGQTYLGLHCNEITLGIELENTNSGHDPYPPAQLQVCAQVIAMWREKYGPLPIVFHRDIDTKGKTDAAGLSMAQLEAYFPKAAPATPPATSTGYTQDTPIVGAARSRLMSDEAAAHIIARGTPNYDADSVKLIALYYWKYAEEAGIDPVMPFAQMWIETDGLRSFWSARPQRNPAGIGVSGETAIKRPNSVEWAYDPARRVWCAGHSFVCWDLSVRAHLGRLLAYALTDDAATPAQRNLIGDALKARPLPSNFRGAAPTWQGLEGRWTTGTKYADSIAALANTLSEGRR